MKPPSCFSMDAPWPLRFSVFRTQRVRQNLQAPHANEVCKVRRSEVHSRCVPVGCTPEPCYISDISLLAGYGPSSDAAMACRRKQ